MYIIPVRIFLIWLEKRRSERKRGEGCLMATITELNRENSHMRRLMRRRFTSIMKELDKKYPDMNYISEKAGKIKDDAKWIVHNKDVMTKKRLKGVM
jgi:hypothetical protein